MNQLIPVSWLRDYLKTDVAAKTIANYLTASGPSVERTEKHGEDQIWDVEVTSNRPDAYSIFGIAREANTILNANGQKAQLVEPVGLKTALLPTTHSQLSLDVMIDAKSLCPRFTAIVVDNVKIGPSPAYIKNRLEMCGIRSINNIVDITNYVMLELGQPMHAFDFDKIKGAKMTLRESKEGESLKTLDGQTRKLPKGTIVIEDAERLVDLCGIMGGENSAISTRTKRVILFAQSYNPIRIRKTTQRLAFRTDAAARFEKGIDLEGVLPALKKSVYLAQKTAGAKIASELIDIYPQKPQPKAITLSFEKLNAYLGIEFPKEKAANILKLLGFRVETTTYNLRATPPSYRHNDMEIPQDLIEEIARVYGYHNLPSKLPEGEIPKSENSIVASVIDLKKALKYLGLTEVLTYSIISKELLGLTGITGENAVELSNPLSEEWQFMRPTIIPSHLGIIAENQNIKANLKIFEVAKTYEGRKADIPIQDLKIAITLQNSSFPEIKGLVENVFEILKRKPQFVSSSRHSGERSDSRIDSGPVGTKVLTGKQARMAISSLLEKFQSAKIDVENQTVGTLGKLNQEIASQFTIEGDTFIAELNLTAIYQLPTVNSSYHPIAKFPPVFEDISAIFDQNLEMAKILAEIKRAGEPLVKNIEVIDIFRSEKLGKNKKSITFRLTYQEATKTPEQEEVTKFRRIIADHLESYLKAQVRK